ncbi:hypothetical protein RD055328_08690 [Companilactobacillus sp. RD055328]|uniref:hypothetical protein n=1 Tax=Companilactobacillus sp. RD055328 TaxID=2916634 RepID=UPI001FC8535A|nr:hypothetical protein [Companilactobacillus sp. RD055328]GKQ42946.1 hypothetical protein RD055328_08690 [Companilactobacillus sp. RD055328]
METTINGINYEINPETITKKEALTIGSKVQVLYTEYSTQHVYPGIVTNIIGFKDNPTIEVTYINQSYSSVDIKTAHITNKTTDYQITVSNNIEFNLNKDNAIELLKQDIDNKKIELTKAQNKFDWFVKQYGKMIEGAK